MALSAAAPPGTGALDDLAWLNPHSDRVRLLTEAPPAPLVLDHLDRHERFLVDIGRIAFHAPDLLGGLAARQGMSCNTCHTSGGANQNFFIEGVSNEPGTFDTTDALFSKVTEDGLDNPVVIPSLHHVAESAPYPSDGRFLRLEDMVTHVIVDEFQGSTPPSLVMAGLLAYLSRLEGPVDPMTTRPVPIRLDTELFEVGHSAETLEHALKLADPRLVHFIVQAMRRQLGRIAQRFPYSTEAQDTLATWSVGLRQIDQDVEAGETREAHRALKRWRRAVEPAALAPYAPTSLYEPAVLGRWLAEQRPAQ